MTTIAEALAIARRACYDARPAELAAVIAIGGLESHWGDSWPETNNWGAITAGSDWTGPTFQHKDSKWTPTGNVWYVTNFRSYPSPEAAAKDLLTLLREHYKPAVAAAVAGDWSGFSARLYDLGYYSGTAPRSQAIASHKKRMADFLRPLRALLDFPWNSAASLLALAIAVGFAILILRKYKHV